MKKLFLITIFSFSLLNSVNVKSNDDLGYRSWAILTAAYSLGTIDFSMKAASKYYEFFTGFTNMIKVGWNNTKSKTPMWHSIKGAGKYSGYALLFAGAALVSYYRVQDKK